MEPFNIGLTVAGIAATFGVAYFGPNSKWAASRSEKVKINSNEFLNYDVGFVSSFYRAEIDRKPSIAYTHVLDLHNGVPEIQFLKQPFRVTDRASKEWLLQRDIAHQAWLNSEQKTNEGRIVRLSYVSEGLIKVSKTTYFEQGKSNLVLDYQQDSPVEVLEVYCLKSHPAFYRG